MAVSPDIIVVGAGINGTSIAFNLAKEGLRVTLIEKDFVAAGPTGRSSAIIRQHYSHEVTARMALRSLHIFQNFDDVVGGDPDFHQTGFLLAARPEDVAMLEANITLQREVGIDTRLVSPQEVKELEPHISIEGIAAAAYEPGSGYADPAATSTAYAGRARDMGASLQLDTRVESILVEGGRVTGVATNKGVFPAGAVVLAAGPWTPLIARSAGIELPIKASRHQVATYRRPDEFDRHMVFAGFADEVYIRPETGQLMLVGSIEPEEAEEEVPDPDSFNERVDFDVVVEFSERVARRYPLMEQGASAGGWASLYDITPDWHAIMGALPGVEGLYCVAGTSGHGFKLGPAVGEMMADLIVNGEKPDADINLFSPRRFTEGKLVRGRYEYSIVG
ncbi:MAG: FAD-binding oxidoreductase [Anaerolineae bacterium]